MIKAFTREQITNLENKYIAMTGNTHFDLMSRAVEVMYEYLSSHYLTTDCICFLCGTGNNAGDGYGVARMLFRTGYNVVCITPPYTEPEVEPAKRMYNMYVTDGGRIVHSRKEARILLDSAVVVVDAIFGIGFHGFITADSYYADMICYANALAKACRIAVDIPSGVHADDGTVSHIVFKADVTLTVTAPKVGMMTYPGRAFSGHVLTICIGIRGPILFNAPSACILPDMSFVEQTIMPYDPRSHKGSHGKLLAIVGSRNMTGAAVMSVGMALRSGVGLVTLASEKEVIDVVRTYEAEPIYKPFDPCDADAVDALCSSLDEYTAILIGCGFGSGEEKKALIDRIIRTAKCRIVLDADGINLIADHINILKEAALPVILTPHPGEFSRMTGLPITDIEKDRLNKAVKFSKRYRCVLVLKGACTIVADHTGRLAVNTSGTPGLAKGGSGDVLAGLVGGLVAQTEIDTFGAVVSAVYLHGKGAQNTEERICARGMLPVDVIHDIAALLP